MQDKVYSTRRLAEPQIDPYGNPSKVFDSCKVPSTGGDNTILHTANMLQDHADTSPERRAADEGVQSLMTTKDHPPESQVLSSLYSNLEARAQDAIDNADHDRPCDFIDPAPGVKVSPFVSPMDIDTHAGRPVPQIVQGSSVVIKVSCKLPGDQLPSSKDRKPGHLYNLMHIRSDKQAMSFVEKVLLSEADVLDLCNHFVPGSARFRENESAQPIINFDVLNSISVQSVGYYGNKVVMTEIFRKNGIISDHATLEKMRDGKLQPGLYVAVQKDTLHMFYWHQGVSLSDASRKDISCNFIRYLVELCHIVHICLDVTRDLVSSLLSSTTTFTKQARKQRLKLFVEKTSENDLKVLPGLEIDISTTMPMGSGKVSDGCDGFLLTEGYHAAALLFATPIPPKKRMKTCNENLKREELASLVANWRAEFNLDVSELDDSQFTFFLEVTGSSGYKDLRDLRENSKHLKESQANKTYDLDNLVSEQEQLALGIFEKAISAYLCLEFHWEENLLSYTSNLQGVELSSETEGIFEGTQDQIASKKPILDGKNALTPGQHGKMQFDDAEGAYNNFEQELSALCTGRQATSPAQLLFSGSEISLWQSTDDTSVYFSNTCDLFIINSAKGSDLGLILYGETCILESSCPPLRVTCLPPEGVFRVGPVIVSEPLILQIQGESLPINGGIQVRKLVDPHPLMTYMGDLAKSTVFHLYRKASLVDPCLTEVKEQLASEDMDLVEHASQKLISAMLSDDWEGVVRDTKFQNDQIDKIKKSWGALMIGEHLGSMKAPEMSTAVKQACVALHKKRRDIYMSKVRTMVIDDIVPSLKQKIEEELRIQMDTLEKQSREKEVAFIGNLRNSYMTLKEDLPTISLLSCTGKILERQMWQKMKDRVKQAVLRTGANPEPLFSITYNKEVLDKEDITWHAVDLAPNKKDLNILSTNPTHVVTLGLNRMAVKLIDIDSTETRLAKVVYLKSGQVLAFLENIGSEPLLTVYRCSTLSSVHHIKPIKELKRPVDAIAFDESSKFVALYAMKLATIQIYNFDQSYSHMDPTGIHLNLAEYTESHNIIWLGFVPGKRELILVDAADCVRLFELTHSAMMRPKVIQLPFPFAKACISADGSYLILFRLISKPDPLTIQSAPGAGCGAITEATACAYTSEVALKARFLVLEIYRLESMLHLKTLDVGMRVDDLHTIQANVAVFGTQMQLLIHDSSRPDVIWSRVLESSSASEVRKMMKVQNNKSGSTAPDIASTSSQASGQKSCPELEYVYHIFDKFSITPALRSSRANRKQEMTLKLVLLKTSSEIDNEIGAKCKRHIENSLEKLRIEKGKNFSKLDLSIKTQDRQEWLEDSLQSKLANDTATIPMGTWLQKAVCLVPLQIARAENNALTPLVDGLHIPFNRIYVDAVALADIVRFGFYESILDGWVGDIKVISSMGKQSSGKSYLLNHLSGSLLDVSGGRCTDGVWMTMRPTEDCLYIILDFEGLGSFERSEQEDMLLSIFNAAISNITIFNKKDFHLDKETEAIFERFQSGVSLVKEDNKLFQGLFYMAIKDVDSSDVEELKIEFQEKIAKICSKSQDNFLTKMYGGEIEIAAMPLFHRPEYYESLNDIAATVEDLLCCHRNGRTFSRDLKLVLSQISTKDWSLIDSKRVAYKLILLNKHLGKAVAFGCLAEGEGETILLNFDTRETINDPATLEVGRNLFHLPDTNIQLAPRDNQVIGDILGPLRAAFQKVVPRLGENDESWHCLFETFLTALAERRKKRVMDWLSANTVDFKNDGDVQKLHLQTLATLAEQQCKLSLCSCKCQRCFLRCILERSHPGDHSCKGNHRCTQACTYCCDDGSPNDNLTKVNGCQDVAGHDGPHDCGQNSHTCGKMCSYFSNASNCNKICILKTRHEGDHKCNSRQHMCKMECSLSECNNPCVMPFELGDHERHVCHEKMCPRRCTVRGCSRCCCTEDHFHGEDDSNGTPHFCGNEHQCFELCEAIGNCEVSTEVVKKIRTFQGKRATFEYDHVSEQNGKRKECCIPIPPFMEEHGGEHSHSTGKNVVHFCDTRCESCGYFCNLPINHTGFHNTTHGNMTKLNFVSEVEDIDILDRKYAWGESGMAEMCMMHCKNLGRGHIHLVPCAQKDGGTCLVDYFLDGVRHETQEYGPVRDVPKDELTHAAFWKYMWFQDPCTDEDQKLYTLCNHRCPSKEHTASSSSEKVSYCEESLWHAPVPRSRTQSSGTQRYVTEDGHRFSCEHSKVVANHVIFIIDRSSSMLKKDCKPTLLRLQREHNNRLGCVYEAILRFIKTRMQWSLQDVVSCVLFDHTACVAFEGKPIAETPVDELLKIKPAGGTKYSAGLNTALSVLLRSQIQNKPPVVIFLSDGESAGVDDPVECVQDLTKLFPTLKLHTIIFNRDNVNYFILSEMARAGNGTFAVSADEIQLASSFETIAKSLRTQVAVLM